MDELALIKLQAIGINKANLSVADLGQAFLASVEYKADVSITAFDVVIIIYRIGIERVIQTRPLVPVVYADSVCIFRTGKCRVKKERCSIKLRILDVLCW